VETGIRLKALQEFAAATQGVENPALADWRSRGGKIVGNFCCYVPEEIVTAAGLLPFRMRATGSTSTELSDAYMSSINCSFCRHVLNMGLRGDYGFVEGLIWLNTCDHVRRVYDNWKRKIDTPFAHMMSLPKKTGQRQVDWYRDELTILKESLEKHFGVAITDERLWEAIGIHNETRRLQRKIYELRKNEDPPITGAEMLSVMVASTAMPRERYNQLLRELLDELSRSEGHADYRARLMIVGGILDDPAYLQIIEDQGGLVVADSLCFGSRLMWTDVDESGGDPLDALSRHYIADRPHCPRMFGEELRRSDYIQEMIREFRVDGVIGEQLMFCDNWTAEHFMLAKDFKEAGIPFLRLDREYLVAGVGQLRTRVQAFLETLGA
jgi:bzd-type benzoyl-CoA reductase N subunit